MDISIIQKALRKVVESDRASPEVTRAKKIIQKATERGVISNIKESISPLKESINKIENDKSAGLLKGYEFEITEDELGWIDRVIYKLFNTLGL